MTWLCTDYHRVFRWTRKPNSWIKSLQSFPPYYSQSPLQLCIEISISSNSCNLLQFLQFNVKEKRGNLKENQAPPYGLRTPYRNLKSENSQDYTQKPQRKCNFMSLASDLCSNSTAPLPVSPLMPSPLKRLYKKLCGFTRKKAKENIK